MFYLHARTLAVETASPSHPCIHPFCSYPLQLPSILPSLLPSFYASPSFFLRFSFFSFFLFFSPLLKTKFRARFMARTSSNAILVYRVWLGRETRLACPDARQLKQADVHDIAQSVIRIGWLIAPGSPSAARFKQFFAGERDPEIASPIR